MPNATTSTAAYNADNELTSWNGTALSYDANGNMLSDGTNTYTWNKRNQLSGISGLVAASFVYGPFGRRQQKTIGGNTTDYLYDGVNPVQELSGTTVTANLLTGLGVDEYFTRTDSTGTSDFLTDALGSTIALADPTGAVQTQYTYSPFGTTTTQGQASSNSYQFTGRENDGDGLYDYRARYYDPMLSRFVSQDPAGFLGGVNVYGYALDGPTVLRDPLGLWTLGAGGSVNINLGFGNIQWSVGVVVDSSGDVGLYNTFGGGGAFAYGGLGRYPAPLNGEAFNNVAPPEEGLGASGGLNLNVSNAKYNCDLAGPFLNASAGLGEGADAGADAFAGQSPHGAVVGGGLTLGGGVGGGGSTALTRTVITPLAGRYSNACGH